jgi:PilZ domain
MAEQVSSERRRAPRRRVRDPIAIIVDGDPKTVADGTFALDLSDLGARVRSQLKLRPGQIVTILQRGDETAGILGQVVWVSEGEGDSEAGLVFLQQLKAPF